jgi:hypothetical protein
MRAPLSFFSSSKNRQVHFTCEVAHGRVVWGKGFGVGRISLVMRPNVAVGDLFSVSLGVFGRGYLDA